MVLVNAIDRSISTYVLFLVLIILLDWKFFLDRIQTTNKTEQMPPWFWILNYWQILYIPRLGLSWFALIWIALYWKNCAPSKICTPLFCSPDKKDSDARQCPPPIFCYFRLPCIPHQCKKFCNVCSFGGSPCLYVR